MIDFRNARVKDHSALEAIDLLADRYAQAKGMIGVNMQEDPLYHPADIFNFVLLIFPLFITPFALRYRRV